MFQTKDLDLEKEASQELLEELTNDLIETVYSRYNAISRSPEALSLELDTLKSTFTQLLGHKDLAATRDVDKLSEIKEKRMSLLPEEGAIFKKIVEAINNISINKQEFVEVCNLPGLMYFSSPSQRSIRTRRQSDALQPKIQEKKELEKLKKERQEFAEKVEELEFEVEATRNAGEVLKAQVLERDETIKKMRIQIENLQEKPQAEEDTRLALRTWEAQQTKERESQKTIKTLQNELKQTKEQNIKDLSDVQKELKTAKEKAIEDDKVLKAAQAELKQAKDKAAEDEKALKALQEQMKVPGQELTRLKACIKAKLGTELIPALLLATYAVGSALVPVNPYTGVALGYVLPLGVLGACSTIGEKRDLKADIFMIIAFTASAADCYLTQSRASAVVCAVALVVGVSNWAGRVASEVVNERAA